MRHALARLVLLSIAFGVLPAAGADEVTIYRCTDASGRLTLRDTPCAKGQQQETRNMLRPKDGAAVSAPRSSRGREDYMAPPARLVVVNPPRPLYECVTPDGDRYSSDTPEGHPRWVPLWTLGYPMAPYPYPGVSSSAGLSITHGGVRIDGGHATLYPPNFGPAAYGAGTWVRDQCYALPQDEVCARLDDRRDEIRRRFFNAMPSERDVLRVEERGINARLDNDCGSY
ncbi:MAG: DUF4124 domain-containing protein [Luteimonas sp.]